MYRVLLVLVALVWGGTAAAEEYRVRSGDTVWELQFVLGHTRGQLDAMNPWLRPYRKNDRLPVGATVTFVSGPEKELALGIFTPAVSKSGKVVFFIPKETLGKETLGGDVMPLEDRSKSRKQLFPLGICYRRPTPEGCLFYLDALKRAAQVRVEQMAQMGYLYLSF